MGNWFETPNFEFTYWKLIEAWETKKTLEIKLRHWKLNSDLENLKVHCMTDVAPSLTEITKVLDTVKSGASTPITEMAISKGLVFSCVGHQFELQMED